MVTAIAVAVGSKQPQAMWNHTNAQWLCTFTNTKFLNLNNLIIENIFLMGYGCIHIQMFYRRQVMNAQVIFLRIGRWCFGVSLVKLPFDASSIWFS